MKYIKYYEEESVYHTEKEDFEFPTVSYTNDSDKVWYMEQDVITSNCITMTFSITEEDVNNYGGEPMIVWNNSTKFDSLTIDGVEYAVPFEEKKIIINGATKDSISDTSWIGYENFKDIYLMFNTPISINDNLDQYVISIIWQYQEDGVWYDDNSYDETVREIMDYYDACIIEDGNIIGIDIVKYYEGWLELYPYLRFIFYPSYNNSLYPSYTNIISGGVLPLALPTTDVKDYKIIATASNKMTDLGCLCESCYNLTSVDLSHFDMSEVINTYSMFYDCINLTSLTLNNIHTSKVIDMSYMFSYCEKLTSLDVSNFDTSKVTTMQSMFNSCGSLTSLDVSNFDTSNVTDMSYMFYGCSGLTSLDVSSFDTSNVIYMGDMFNQCSNLTSLDLSNFDTSKVTGMGYMFNDCSNLTSITFGPYTSAVILGSLHFYDMFNGINTTGVLYYPSAYTTAWEYVLQTKQDNSKFPTTWTMVPVNYEEWKFAPSHIVTATYYATTYGRKTLINSTSSVSEMFINGQQYSLSIDYYMNANEEYNVTYILSSLGNNDLSSLFSGCTSLTSIDISQLDTSNVTDMSKLFYFCTNLTSLDISNFDTSNVTDMSWMFYGCSGLTSLDVSNFDTSNVTNMLCMFDSCSNLTSLDVSHFDTSNVTNMQSMFDVCSGLTSLDVSNFNTSAVTNMGEMFYMCSGLTSLDVSHFDTSNVTNMTHMFSNCSNLTSLDLSNFNTSNIDGFTYMFSNCSGLTSLDLSSFDTNNAAYLTSMFENCSNLTSIIFGQQGNIAKAAAVGDYRVSLRYVFEGITTTGTLYCPLAYLTSWENILITKQGTSKFPSTWTIVPIDYENGETVPTV